MSTLLLQTTTEVTLDQAALAALIQRWLEADRSRLTASVAWVADDLAKHIVERAGDWSRAARAGPIAARRAEGGSVLPALAGFLWERCIWSMWRLRNHMVTLAMRTGCGRPNALTVRGATGERLRWRRDGSPLDHLWPRFRDVRAVRGGEPLPRHQRQQRDATRRAGQAAAAVRQPLLAHAHRAGLRGGARLGRDEAHRVGRSVYSGRPDLGADLADSIDMPCMDPCGHWAPCESCGAKVA